MISFSRLFLNAVFVSLCCSGLVLSENVSAQTQTILFSAEEGGLPQNSGGSTEQQQVPFSEDEVLPETPISYERTSSLSAGEERFDLKTLPSTLFTYWEQAVVVEAMLSEGFSRPPTDAEILDGGEVIEDRPKPPPEERYLTLGGIVYRSAQKWTVWFNGKRVTPQALPAQAIDFKVRKDFIEVKWYDEYTNQIYPVRLRPHQRFNIDTRIFLPG
jgi:hypothetical protein